MFFRVLIYSQTKVNSCIATIMTATLGKAVELEYSGFGRSDGGHAKRSFSTTQTCITMKEAIIDKLGEVSETENLQSKISKWLSGAKDRKGGRKEALRRSQKIIFIISTNFALKILKFKDVKRYMEFKTNITLKLSIIILFVLCLFKDL